MPLTQTEVQLRLALGGKSQPKKLGRGQPGSQTPSSTLPPLVDAEKLGGSPVSRYHSQTGEPKLQPQVQAITEKTMTFQKESNSPLNRFCHRMSSAAAIDSARRFGSLRWQARGGLLRLSLEEVSQRFGEDMRLS